MAKIKSYPFSRDSLSEIRNDKYGTNWPVVYILNNSKEAYIGESSNVFNRTKNHLENKDRKELETINVIYDEKFNKSAILDIESFLIQYFSADKKFTLQNGNAGQSQEHDYYQRQLYIDEVEDIWRKLKRKKLVNNELDVLKNSDLFKFSPYKSLSEDQFNTAMDIAFSLVNNLKKEKERTFVVNGAAGTGKTILAVYLTKLISDFATKNYDNRDLEDEDGLYEAISDLKNQEYFKIGLVFPMRSLRKTLRRVFKNVDGLKPNMIIGPSDVTKDRYDLLIVDEAHRLKRRLGITNYNSHDNNNKKLGLDNNGTELDWIMKCSKYQILFYDYNQSIRPSDVRKEDFTKIINKPNTDIFNLRIQMRVKGGDTYISYIKNVFSGKQTKKENIENYDFKIFDDVKEMTDLIIEKDKKYGLCRNVAGYSWEWKTKGQTYDAIIKSNEFDIDINNNHYIWNTTNDDWVNSKHAIDEVGCIHMVQGYDLNYAGIIIGNELSYDKVEKKIILKKENYFDSKGRISANDQELLEYIINIYTVVLTRGILGTYIYVCDKNLRDYMKQFI